jgi:hypothetical protein
MFGYAQGGSIALETAVADRSSAPLGSITSVCGPLVSHPTFSPALSTPLCYVVRIPRALRASAPHARAELAAVHRAFAHVTEVHLAPSAASTGTDMVRGTEWKDVMLFWARFWRKRSAWERQGELYTVS